MGRIAQDLFVWTGLVCLFALAFLTLFFALGVVGAFEETTFHNGLIWLLGHAQDALLWGLGRSG